MKNEPEQPSIRADRYLQWMTKAGIPLAIISIASLWIGQAFHIPQLGSLFIIFMPLTLMIGFAYNIRYFILAARRRRKS
ncbi:MAG: hypothetical protein V7739_04850 [Motiliproteus sp.]